MFILRLYLSRLRNIESLLRTGIHPLNCQLGLLFLHRSPGLIRALSLRHLVVVTKLLVSTIETCREIDTRTKDAC